MLAQQAFPASAVSHPRVTPSGPWQWSQRWRDLLFLHWQLPGDVLRPLLPTGLELDTWDGMAWLGVVAFRLEAVRPRWLPPIRPFSNFLEVNLRTYVRCRAEPGIAFLSIHASKRSVVGLARWFTPLPYVFARITSHHTNERRQFHAQRPIQEGERPLFRAEFTPVGAAAETAPGSLDDWLLERYAAFVPDRRGRLRRMSVQHPRWQVQDAILHDATNCLGEPWGLSLRQPPEKIHYTAGLSGRLWPFEIVRP